MSLAMPRDPEARPLAESSAPPVAAVPPLLPGSVIRRSRLEQLLDAGMERRLTTVVADAGFGKSTLLAAWSAGRLVAWHAVSAADRDPTALAAAIVRSLSLRVPGMVAAAQTLVDLGRGPQAATDEARRSEALAGAICASLEASLTDDVSLVLDDLEVLDVEDASAALVAAICRQAPSRLHLILSSRAEPPFVVERLRLQGQVLRITGPDLAFRPVETRALVAAILGDDSRAIADRLHAATGGWPAAVRLAGEALGSVEPAARVATLDRLLRTGDPIVEAVVAQLLAAEPPAIRRLVATMSLFDRFTSGICEAVGVAVGADTLAELSLRGLFVQPIGDGGWYAIHPVVRAFAADRLAPTPRDRAAIVRRGAGWALAAGADREALSMATTHGQSSLVRRILTQRGSALLAAGHIDLVIEAAAALRRGARTPAIVRLEGEARQVRGDWDGALALFRSLPTDGGSLDPGLAWRMGLIHHMRGELNLALEVYQQGVLHAGAADDRALLRAWTAAALWLRGDVVRVRALADEALAIATEAGDHRALAVTHTVLAMVAALDGDPRANDVHYLRALDHALAGGEVLTQIRIRANRGSRFNEEGAYRSAIEELDEAIRLGELTGFAAFHALALSNRGQALYRLGRLEEARSDLEQSRAIYQRLESRMVAYPLHHLGDVYRERGDRAMALAQYEEAIAVSEPAGDLQGLVPALTGLALVLAEEDPDRAAIQAMRAVEMGPALGRTEALLALGWARLRQGDRDAARAAVVEAASLSRQRRDRAGLAEALELEAALETDPDVARTRLAEARSIWDDIGSVRATARMDRGLAALSPPADPLPTPSATAGRRARRASGGRPPDATIEIRTLGGFEARRDGELIRVTAWGSRRARDLVKILVSRRGHHVAREQLMELLWPEEDPARTSRRLSVMISTARTVLDPDRRLDPPGGIGADRDAVWLALPTDAVDVERFLASAADGLALVATDGAAAQAVLIAATEAYRGDFLEDDPYADWAVALREEARNVYIEAEHALARLSAQAGTVDDVARHLRRVLEREPYDEAAHLGLVEGLARSGRPADARRAYRAYVARMDELSVEAAPFPVVGATV
jgi:DNA-binding SARP family transcriptional activator/tetratricopeptide (TPR) repeat protein